jgi:hypothetical protein
MKRNEFINKLDNEIMPAVREQILKAYDEGYTECHQDSSLEGYLKSHNLTINNIVNLGLPSGTIWIDIDEVVPFTKAKELGLQFPSTEQIEEFKKCKFEEHKWSATDGGIYVVGLNGNKRIILRKGAKFCLWAKDAVMDDNFEVWGERAYFEERLGSTQVYAGEKFYTLFVLPDYVK